jgi:hypothetical protein
MFADAGSALALRRTRASGWPTYARSVARRSTRQVRTDRRMGTSHELVPKPSLIETNRVLAYFLRSGAGLPTRSRDSLAADNPRDHAAEPRVKEVDSGRLVEPVALNAIDPRKQTGYPLFGQRRAQYRTIDPRTGAGAADRLGPRNGPTELKTHAAATGEGNALAAQSPWK